MREKVTIDYTNWKGERRVREIIPTGGLRFSTTGWHSSPQWLLAATDVEDGVVKEFAMKHIHSWKPAS